MAATRARQRLNVLVFFVCAVFFVTYFRGGLGPSPRRSGPSYMGKSVASRPGSDDLELVVASMKKENVSWLHDYLQDWTKNIYVVDDPTAPLTVPVNKGREAMVFLTYVFVHSPAMAGCCG